MQVFPGCPDLEQSLRKVPSPYAPCVYKTFGLGLREVDAEAKEDTQPGELAFSPSPSLETRTPDHLLVTLRN